ncbi:hypothetical protein IGI04_007964 [Brassica rapa subsp. trilocularis]|uniref:TIR domain-containing protein n=2 Tax=Brassica TaxID=3705 RepID=A0ABQ7NLG2_BRACM|nr:hypothetical protein IGI04_007964 [Brassica rapa subsp. trilocularis]CAF2143202.1 unnamed protein product [Brassica napus]
MTPFYPCQDPQVFINYRGEELRYRFVSHLVAAFERDEINFFIDKNELRGTDLRNLFARIHESRIALNPNHRRDDRYAESSWCMNELAKIKELADKEKLHVVPIFYKLKVGDVRGQTGKFGTKFWNLARASTGDQIKTWKEALECISDKMGLSLKDQSSEADFVKEIVTEVRRVVAAMGLEEGRDHNVNHSGNKKRGWEFQF